MIKTGMIFDLEDTKRNLAEMNRDYNNRRTWYGAKQDTNLSAARAQQNITSDFSGAINNAYSSYLANKQAIGATDLTASSQERLDTQNQIALENAYNEYLNTWQQNRAAIEEQRIGTQAGIDKALETEAKNVRAYQQAHYQYLENLYENNPDLFANKQWNRFLVSESDEEGNAIDRLMTEEEFYNDNYKLMDYIDQLQNSPDLYGNTFDRFLAETNIDALLDQGYTVSEAKQLAKERKDLYDWSKSYNPWNWTSEGSQKGTFKELFGLDSTDAEYHFAERFGGMNREEIDAMYKDFYDAAKSFEGVNLEKDAKKPAENIKNMTQNVFNLAKELGIDGELRKQGFTEDNMMTVMEEATKAMQSNVSMNVEWWTKILTSMGVGASTGAASGKAIGAGIGATIGTAGGPIGTAGGAATGGTIGGIAGAIIGLFSAVIPTEKAATKDIERQKRVNKQNAEMIKKGYLDLITAMTAYSQEVRRQSEIDFLLK